MAAGDGRVLELHVAGRVLPKVHERRAAEGERFDDALLPALAHLQLDTPCARRDRLLIREIEGVTQPQVEVGAALDLQADVAERLAELVRAAAAADAPKVLSPIVGRDDITALTFE